MVSKKIVDTETEKLKKKTCFIVMPIADMDGYDKGHFDRVYNYLIKPALDENIFDVTRADETKKSNVIIVEIVKNIMEADLVVCDISGRNPNVLYELGMRHAYDKPVVLIKDERTQNIFDIQTIRYLEYNSTLRIDSVESDVGKLKEFIKSTMDNPANTMSSVVKFAKMAAATEPENSEMNPDTIMLMNAISSLSKRIESVSPSSRFPNKLSNLGGLRGLFGFTVIDGVAHFSDKSSAIVGDDIFRNGVFLGTISGMKLDDVGVPTLFVSNEEANDLKIFNAFGSEAKALHAIK